MSVYETLGGPVILKGQEKMKRILLTVILSTAGSNVLAQQEAWGEFMSGQRSTYSSAGVEKARNLEISFDYPISWAGGAGRRPNTLYQVASNHGKGLEICSLIVRPIPISGIDMTELFEPNGLAELVPPGGLFIDGRPTELDGQPGAWITFSQTMDRAGIPIQMVGIMYLAYYEDNLIILGCVVGADAGLPPAVIQVKYLKFFPLFQQIANSIIIHSKWKTR